MKTPRFYGKTTASLMASLFFMSGVQQAQATLLDPAQSPLILSESVAPNLIFTLDDSGSMRWAFTPDSYNNLHETRRAKSSSFNPMYYNPAVTYQIPVKYAADGARASTQYSTSFASAYNNGLNTAKGAIDLRTNYRVTWSYDPASIPAIPGNYGYATNDTTANKYAMNPTADFNHPTSSSTTTPGPSTATAIGGQATYTGNTNTVVAVGGVSYRITRTTTNPFCTATITTGSSSTSSTVTQNNTPTWDFTTTAVTTTTTSYSNPGCSRSSSSSSTYNVTGLKTVSSSTVTTQSRVNMEKTGVPAYYYAYDTTLTSCTSPSTTNDDCYRLVLVTSSSGQTRSDDTAAGRDERENFARWFSFYRNRSLTTLSAANLAFTGLPRSIRLTWQTINSCSSFSSTSCSNNFLRKFTGNHVGNFFNWLPTVPFSSGTSLRSAMVRAGSFITGNTSDAWAYNPNPFTSSGGNGTTVQEPKYSCRANYQIMMTDGVWNNTYTKPTDYRPDQTEVKLPDGTDYTLQHPYSDVTTETLADLAFHYWATDASKGTGGLSNDVKPIIVSPNASDAAAQYWNPKNDPATWQHLTTYTVGLGLNSSLTAPGIPWTGDTNGGAGYDALVAGTQWPPAASDSANNVYDMWHAALNSRGEFFSADSPDAVVAAFAQIISRISNRTTSAGAPGVTASVVEDTLNREVYETQLNSEDWSGNLTKFSIDSSGTRTEEWSAKAGLNSKTASARNIKMVSSTGALTDFSWSNLSSAQQAMLNRDNDQTNTPTDTKGEARLNYIRGDQSAEGSTTGTFRIRSTVLGDIINSSPVIVGTPKYVPYLADAIEGVSGDHSYSEFKADNRAEKLSMELASPRRPMVYVGANDGMLHGFDANTNEERFAFVPSAVIQNLYKLSAQRYTGSGHQFYVDGTPVVNDVYFNNAWHTVLVGTLRAGGRSLFALDVTDPDAITLLWEKSYTDTGMGNLGYTFPQPVIARMHSGNWAVVIGNGYGNQTSSTADNASLMILDVATGELQRELVVSGDASKANGLSSVRLADNNSDGVADYAYAGDLQGNMWRFDLVTTSATPAQPDPFKRGTGFLGDINPSHFAVSYGGTPLYTATDSRTSGATAQAITAPPSLVRHPSTLGYLVIFGTGKYFETNDGTVDSTRAQTLYGIWDRKTKGQTTSSRTAPTRSDLQTQTITSQPANPFTANVGVEGIRIISQNPVQWYDTEATGTTDSDVDRWGWALDFKVANSSPTYSGEMLINPMAARGQTLLLNTLTPNSDPCKEGVDSWLYGLDPNTGGRTKFNVFDLDNSKTIDDNDSYSSNGVSTVVSSYKKPGSGGFTTNNGDIYTAPSQGGGMKYSAGPTSSGRQSWRAIPERETLE